MQTAKIEPAGRLIGTVIENYNGDRLGVLREFLIDVENGNVVYIILSQGGGFLSRGEKYFAVPWRAIEIAQDSGRFFLNIERESLAGAPSFEKDNWPDMNDSEWSQSVHQFYGVEPWETVRRPT